MAWAFSRLASLRRGLLSAAIGLPLTVSLAACSPAAAALFNSLATASLPRFSSAFLARSAAFSAAACCLVVASKALSAFPCCRSLAACSACCCCLTALPISRARSRLVSRFGLTSGALLIGFGLATFSAAWGLTVPVVRPRIASVVARLS